MFNRMLLMSLMVMITALGLAKVGLPLWFEESQVQFNPVEPVQQLVVEQTTSPLAWQVQWLAHELIPSAEAAEGMTLVEERDTRDNQTGKVMALREQQQKLNYREKSLDEREEEVKNAEGRIQEKIIELEQLEARIRGILNEEKSIKNKKIKRLTAVYEGMKAERAAPVIAQMNLTIVVKIFSRMSEKQVGKILSFLPPQKAVVISQALTERIASVR